MYLFGSLVPLTGLRSWLVSYSWATN